MSQMHNTYAPVPGQAIPSARNTMQYSAPLTPLSQWAGVQAQAAPQPAMATAMPPRQPMMQMAPQRQSQRAYSEFWTKSSPMVPDQSRKELSFVPIGQGEMAVNHAGPGNTDFPEDSQAVISVQDGPPEAAQMPAPQPADDLRDIVSSLLFRLEALEFEVAALKLSTMEQDQPQLQDAQQDAPVENE